MPADHTSARVNCQRISTCSKWDHELKQTLESPTSENVQVRRRRLWLLAQLILGLGLLIAWALIVDLPAVGRTLAQARWGYVLLSALIWLASGILRTLRWRIVLSSVARLPFIDLWLVNAAAALINFLIPLRTAEIAKSLLLKHRHGTAISSSLTSVAFDRVFDLLAVLGLGFGGAMLGAGLNADLSAMLIAGGALLLAFALVVLLAFAVRNRLPALLARLWPARLGEKLLARVQGMLEQVLRVMTMLVRKPKEVVPLLGLSLAAGLMDALSLLCIFLALGSSASFLLVLTGYALFTLTFLIPSAPGYVGSMEALGLLVFGTLGVDHDLAASVIVLNHALAALLLGVTGGLAMSALGVKPGMAASVFGGGEAMDVSPARPKIDN